MFFTVVDFVLFRTLFHGVSEVFFVAVNRYFCVVKKSRSVTTLLFFTVVDFVLFRMLFHGVTDVFLLQSTVLSYSAKKEP